MLFALFVRCLSVCVPARDPLVASVAQEFHICGQHQTRGFVERKVMCFARANRHTHDALTGMINHDLRFLGVAPLFAGVELALFFWGRSMRCSLASTISTLHSTSEARNVFLPGR